MKIAIIDPYYPKFLSSIYKSNSSLESLDWKAQNQYIQSQMFGVSDAYSHNLAMLGIKAQEFVSNCPQLQAQWAQENGVVHSKLALSVSHRFFRIPLIGQYLSRLPGLCEIAIAQVEDYKPDVLYCQDLSFFPPAALQRLKRTVKLVVGQIACPLPPNEFLAPYDLILTSFPHYVKKIRSLGVRSEYFKIAFDNRVLNGLGTVEKDISVSFVGGITRHHSLAMPLFEHLARTTPIEFFGYGARNLPWRSRVRRKHRGEVWGKDMYLALARSKILLNRHISSSENFANNMRLYEATGVGSLLLTDAKDNLSELFEIDKEIVTYSSIGEAEEKIKYYVDNPEKAAEIAKAGQQRTLKEHSYSRRMKELSFILEKYL